MTEQQDNTQQALLPTQTCYQGMTFQYVEDEFGETMRLLRIHKNRYLGQTFSAEATEGISKVALRDDDILICAYPKSGGHWLWENIRMLTTGEVILDTSGKDSMMMEFFNLGEQDNFPSPRILNNHCFFDDQPLDLIKGKTKVIFLYRNPKDIAVSFFHHISQWAGIEYTGSFHNFLRRLVKGIIPFNSPFDYWKMWENGIKQNPKIPLVTVTYEDLQIDTVGELRRISKFLGYDRDDQLLKSIAQATSFDSIVSVKSKDCLLGKDGAPLMYRKGKVGDWKNHFTVSDNEWFEDIIQTELGDSELFKCIYSLD